MSRRSFNYLAFSTHKRLKFSGNHVNGKNLIKWPICVESTHRPYLEFSISFSILLLAVTPIWPYNAKASKNTTICLISETSTVTPQFFFCLSGMSGSLSNCSKSLKKHLNLEDLGCELLEQKKGQVLVQWKGWPNMYNSWIPSPELKKTIVGSFYVTLPNHASMTEFPNNRANFLNI